MPRFESKGLCDQLRRAVVSIPSNIAEGAGRSSTLEFSHFLDIAKGSCNEIDTQILIAKNIGYIDEGYYNTLLHKIQHVSSQLYKLIKTVRTE